MSNIEQAFMNHTHVDKIRTAKFVTHTINATQEDIKAKDGKMNTVLGLLAKGDMNCAGNAVSDDLFSNQSNSTGQSSQVTPNRQARQASEIPAGVIRTEAEKQKAEEERRRQQEEEDRARQEEERIKQEEEARIRKENSPWNKLKKGILKFGKSIVEEED